MKRCPVCGWKIKVEKSIMKGKVIIESTVNYDSISATDTYLSYSKDGEEVANISKINVIE